jgi:hypothetical protein
LADIVKEAETIDSLMTAVETKLYQTKNRSGQDPLNFPIQLNNKLAHLASLASVGDARPTDQALQFYEEITARIDEQLKKWEKIKETKIPAFNQMVKEAEVDVLMLE